MGSQRGLLSGRFLIHFLPIPADRLHMETGMEKHQAHLPATQLEAQLAVVQSAAKILGRCVVVVFAMTTLGDGFIWSLRVQNRAIGMLVDGLFVSICCLPLLYISILRPLARLAAEQGAAAAEARFRIVAQAMRDAITIFDARGTIRFVNRAAEGMLGYSPGALIGAKLETLMPEERREAFRSDLRAFASGGPTAFIGKGPVERVSQRKNGERFPVELTWDRLPADDAQKEITFVVIQREITARKQAEAALRESEALFRNMTDTAPVMIWISDLSRKLTFFNRVWLDFRGRPMEAEIGDGWSEGVHPEDYEACQHAYNQAFEARQGFDLEFRLRRADGEYRWVLERTAPRYAADGTFAGFIGSCLDVTERKQAEEVLRASEKHFRELLESLPVAVRIIQGGTIVFANAADARLHGFDSPEQEIAMDGFTHISEQDRPRLTDYVRRRAAGEEAPRRYEVGMLRRDGSEFRAELDVERVIFNGAPAVLVAIRDLTDRKRIEMYEKLLPVCCVCGKIRDDANTEHGAGNWGRFEEYLAAHSDTQFSHTFCPECFEDYRKKNLMP
jgi:PAS domain S-box-containing protein